MLEWRSDFIGKPLQRLLIVGSRKVEVYGVETEIHVRRQLINDHVGRPDQSRRTFPSAVGSPDLGYDLLRSRLGPAHDHRAGHEGPLDLIAVAPKLLAPASQNAVLMAQRL